MSATAQDTTPGGRRIEDDIRALSRLDRRTTTDGELRSAHLLAERLRAIGAADVTTSTFRGPRSWGPAHLGYLGAAGLLAAVDGLPARLACLLVGAAYEVETSGRTAVLQRAVSTGRGTTVRARLPATSRATRTVVIAAHHDAAQTGLVWHPRTVAASRWLARRTGRALPSHLPVLLGVLAAAAPSRAARAAAGVGLAVSAGAMIESWTSRTTPGANDNASGVAAVLEVARLLRRDPPETTDVILVLPGGEEVGNAGMRAWFEQGAPPLDPATTLVVNLDSVGSGGRLVTSHREGLSTTFADRDVALVLAAAAQEGIPLDVADIPNATDAVLARHRGLRTVSLLSLADGWIRHLHRDADTPDAVDLGTVEEAVRLTLRLVTRWARPERGDID